MTRFELIDQIEMMELGLMAAADPKFAEKMVEEFLSKKKSHPADASPKDSNHKIGSAA